MTDVNFTSPSVIVTGSVLLLRFVVVFTMYALGILLLNEWILPSTPLRAWRDRRAAERVDIRNIRDELALSARGRPIGIRVTFEAVFPEDGDYRVAPSALGTIDRNLPLALQFLRSVQSTIEPHSGKGEAMPARAASYVTSRPYDVEAMYQTIVAEGNKRCTQSRP